MIEHCSPDDPHGRIRCQTYSKQGAHCVRYQDHGGAHLYAFRPTFKRWLAPKPTSESPELSEAEQTEALIQADFKDHPGSWRTDPEGWFREGWIIGYTRGKNA